MASLFWGFQSPWLLLAMLGILVPIAIHIFSKSKGQRIAFGSLKFIKQSKPVKMTQLRLVDPLLLLLRVLLVIVTVLFLAQFYFSSTQSSQEVVVFVSEDWLNSSTMAEKKHLLTKQELTNQELTKQALANNENNIYLLNAASIELSATSGKAIALSKDDVLNWHENSVSSVNLKPKNKSPISSSLISVKKTDSFKRINLWTLLDRAIQFYPNAGEFVVYSTDRLNQFYGDKLTLPAKIDWQILAVNNKNNFAKPTSPIKPLKLIVIVDNEQEKSTTNTSDEDKLDQIKLQKALSFITVQFPQISVKYINSTQAQALSYLENQSELTPDWILYLSKQAVPNNILSHVASGNSLLVPYENGQTLAAVKTKLQLLTPVFQQQFARDLPNIQTHKLALGNIYSLKQLDKQHSHEQKDDWHNLLQQNYFPQILVNLLTRQQQTEYQLKHTSLTTAQIIPQKTSQKMSVGEEEMLTAKNTKNAPETQLLLFVLLLVIWALERLISEFSSNKNNNKKNKNKYTAQVSVEGYRDV